MRRSQKGRQRMAAGRLSTAAVETEFARIAEMSIEDLREAWSERFGAPAPRIRSGDVLLRMMAWRIQAEVFGGLDGGTERKLNDVARAFERDGNYEPKTRRDLSPGVVLTREWKGVTRRVIVTSDGFQHHGKTHRSLSDVARTITGTRWSGPRFFGLEQKPGRKAQTETSRAVP